MANQLVWEERFNIGVDVIDKEHKRLFKIINKLFSFEEDESLKGQWACQEGIKFFKDHAVRHFADEEKYMDSINYSDKEVHKRIHENFCKNILPALEKELVDTDYSEDSVNHFLGVCVGWLISHTLTEDHAIVGKGKNKWVNLLPKEEHEAIKDMVVKLVFDLFQLNANIVSENYGGEKFGRGIYYRIVYGNKKGEKCETILAFEERLLINTVGKMIGEKLNKVSIMTINATRYMARQFVENIMEHFPPVELFELKSENLLTYEQMKKVFEREKPQVSLLLDTGEGYFAYCAIAPHFNNINVGTSIEAGNAMDEIGKYLKKNKESKKKKILVVDDSSVIRKTLKELFNKDYAVALAESGLATIRCITLDRPDLILLDYEMPVCDGKQVLEMIRAEKNFADIPVIFLTGRGDAESVKNVMALKPAGYLLKTLKPDDLKKVIDDYFAERK